MNKDERREVLLKSFLAGSMIALAGYGYVMIENKILGSCLFSLGLLTIISKGLVLYTGQVYKFVLTKYCIKRNLLILLGNFLGAFLVVGLCARYLGVRTNGLWAVKLAHNVPQNLILSIFCGIMMYLAVSLYAKEKNPIYVTMPIMFFILTGCEHSIANMFYLAVSSTITLQHIGYILVNIVGNAIGSILFYRLERSVSKDK